LFPHDKHELCTCEYSLITLIAQGASVTVLFSLHDECRKAIWDKSILDSSLY